jgi:ABC-2 type transport system ATP-binding protein
MATAAIKVKNLTKSFGNLTAVNKLNLEIQQGEVFGFLGPNGAGKTTTIRMLMNFIFPDSGKVELLGLDLEQHSAEIMQNVGYIAGDIALYESYTVGEFLKYMEQLQGKRSKKKTELLERFDLAPNRKIRQLSKGNKQKVAIIQAFMFAPKLLILDEPTSGLDPLLQIEFYKLITELKSEGSTVFFSSHVLSEVQRVCDRVGIIRKGNLIAIETIRSLTSKNIYDVELLGTNKISLQDLRLKNVSAFKTTHESVTFTYSGDINLLLKNLSRFNLLHVSIKEPDLEQLFLHYYEQK